MKFLKHRLYIIKWKDIYHTSEWVGYNDVDRVIKEAEKKIINSWYFIKETPLYYIFTSGMDKNEKSYFDIVILPRKVIYEATPIKNKEK